MDNQQAYNTWATQYDTNKNLTRDLEAIALRKTLEDISFSSVLEIGCGTGKNSEWFVSRGKSVTAVDFSAEMLAKAKEKIVNGNISFHQADITHAWTFADQKFDLASFSLILEHIRDLDFIFSQLKEKVLKGGHVFIGELHPFKQYNGSLARFDTEAGRVELDCFTHHISEFINAATANGFSLIRLKEWFDENDEGGIPRILTLLFRAE